MSLQVPGDTKFHNSITVPEQIEVKKIDHSHSQEVPTVTLHQAVSEHTRT